MPKRSAVKKNSKSRSLRKLRWILTQIVRKGIKQRKKIKSPSLSPGLIKENGKNFFQVSSSGKKQPVKSIIQTMAPEKTPNKSATLKFLMLEGAYRLETADYRKKFDSLLIALYLILE